MCSSPTSPSTSCSQDCTATPAFNFRKNFKYWATAGVIGLLILGFATCSGAPTPEACPLPVAGSQAATVIDQAKQKTRFPLSYPCYLPNSEELESHSVTGDVGKQRSEFVFSGPFDIAIRQAQVPPPVEPDPTGASRRSIFLFDGIQASFIERTDGTSKALYHLYWERDGYFWELQAFGPYQQQRTILQIARSLAPLP